MIITDAKPVRKGRTQIYIDGEAAVQVSARLFGESRFQIGGEISDEELLDHLDLMVDVSAR